jgi:hypothetical protein
MPRWVELRRHAPTKKGALGGTGSHLSQAGVSFARAEGAAVGPVAHVVVSREPRTLETALAMGFAVDRVDDIRSSTVTGSVRFHEWWTWSSPFDEFGRRIASCAALGDYARRQQAIVARAADAVDDGQAALVIGHGGWIEPVLVACVPHEDVSAWGPPFRHLEGARLGLDDDQWSVVSLHRIDDDGTGP